MQPSKNNQKPTIRLIVEADDGTLWGRVEYDDDLIVEQAKTLDELQANVRKLLADFHELDPDTYQFQIEYDLTAFFEQHDYLKITKIAELAGLNGSLLRQYVTGKKHPSAQQVVKIEGAVKQLAQQLSEVHFYAR